MDFLTKCEIQSELERIRELLDARIMWYDLDKIYRQSVLIELLICLNDLLMKAKKEGNKISFTNDIVADAQAHIHDVTDLVTNFRDCVCHSNTSRNKIGQSKFTFNEIRSKGRTKIDDFIVENHYEDDIAFVMGRHVLYLKRHIERAFAEVEVFLEPLSQM